MHATTMSRSPPCTTEQGFNESSKWQFLVSAHPLALIAVTSSTVMPKMKMFSLPISSLISTLAPSRVPIVKAPFILKWTKTRYSKFNHSHTKQQTKEKYSNDGQDTEVQKEKLQKFKALNKESTVYQSVVWLPTPKSEQLKYFFYLIKKEIQYSSRHLPTNETNKW